MLALILIVAAIAVALVGLAVWTRRTHDDEHSVEGYHRQLHTLEVLRRHTEGQSEEAKAALPESAFRVTPTPTVRLTEPGKPIVPPVPPPPVANPDKPITFDDAGTVVSTPILSGGSASAWHDDKAMHGIDHRPRRLAAPAAAVAGVTVLIVILVITGFHNNPPPHHHGTTTTAAQAKSTPTTKAPAAHHRTGRRATTTTTVPPFVSLPRATSAHAANYTVQQTSYTLAMSATSSSCWVDATNATSGAVLYTGVINSGQTQTVTADGPVSIVVGAPNVFTANVNGTAVSFPFGFMAPFTMHLLPVGAAAAGN